jgi:PEP-CTERM motif
MANYGAFASMAVLVALLAPASAAADPIRLTFTYEPSPPGCATCYHYQGFSFSFVTTSFVTTPGVFKLSAPIKIGTDTITHAGTNHWGQWIFGNGVGESITPVTAQLTFDTLAFGFDSPTPGYIDHPGTFTGYDVQGQTSYLTQPVWSVSGTGTVDVSVVPEPGTFTLVGTGALIVIGRWRRRRAYRPTRAFHSRPLNCEARLSGFDQR